MSQWLFHRFLFVSGLIPDFAWHCSVKLTVANIIYFIYTNLLYLYTNFIIHIIHIFILFIGEIRGKPIE